MISRKYLDSPPNQIQSIAAGPGHKSAEKPNSHNFSGPQQRETKPAPAAAFTTLQIRPPARAQIKTRVLFLRSIREESKILGSRNFILASFYCTLTDTVARARSSPPYLARSEAKERRKREREREREAGSRPDIVYHTHTHIQLPALHTHTHTTSVRLIYMRACTRLLLVVVVGVLFCAGV